MLPELNVSMRIDNTLCDCLLVLMVSVRNLQRMRVNSGAHMRVEGALVCVEAEKA